MTRTKVRGMDMQGVTYAEEGQKGLTHPAERVLQDMGLHIQKCRLFVRPDCVSCTCRIDIENRRVRKVIF